MENIFSVYPGLSSLLGAFLTLLAALFCSYNRKAISVSFVCSAVVFQTIFMLALTKSSLGGYLLSMLVALTKMVDAAAQQGIAFVFGALGSPSAPWGFIFAIHVLPIIIFFSALISALTYLGVVGTIINIVSGFMRPLLGTSGPETTVSIAKSFLGPTESVVLVKDHFSTMTNSELFAVMVSGLTMISGSLFAIYMGLGAPGKHLIAANLMGILGSLLFAKIIFPSQMHHPVDRENPILNVDQPRQPQNLIEAIIQGSLDGLQLVLAVGALLISFIALMVLLNAIFCYVGSLFGFNDLTFERCIGYLFAPCGFLMGLPTSEAFKVAELIGIKCISNEMVAFGELACKNLSERGLILATYALCGFGNISCMGIVVGAITTLAPARGSRVSSMAWRALAAATLSNLFSAYLVGIFL